MASSGTLFEYGPEARAELVTARSSPLHRALILETKRMAERSVNPTSFGVSAAMRHLGLPPWDLFGPVRLGSRIFGKVVCLVGEWRQRARSRGELARLTNFDLKDIGFPGEFYCEKSKPFWKP
jgi:uncharacterized protein YjiS (DUF1127 family)